MEQLEFLVGFWKIYLACFVEVRSKISSTDSILPTNLELPKVKF